MAPEIPLIVVAQKEFAFRATPTTLLLDASNKVMDVWDGAFSTQGQTKIDNFFEEIER